MVSLIEKEKIKYPPHAYHMNFTSNHDENTWKGTEYERLNSAVKTFAVLLVTMPGMPLVYSGQEACLDKRLRFFDKDTIDWAVNCELDELYTSLLKLKKENQALWNGEFGGDLVRIPTSADDKIFAFVREKEGNKIISVFNLSAEKIDFTINYDVSNESFIDIFSNSALTNNLSFDAWGYMVFKN